MQTCIKAYLIIFASASNSPSMKDDLNEEAEAKARADADKLYFAQRKAGVVPSKKAEETDELITFVEDGLNRPNLKPKPKLGERRVKKPIPKQPVCRDLIGRKLCKLGPTSSKQPVSAFIKCLEIQTVATSLFVFMGFESFPTFAALNRLSCMATREPDWRLLTELIAFQYGLLVVPLIPEHPAPRITTLSNNNNSNTSKEFSWKETFATIYKIRFEKWGLVNESAVKKKKQLNVKDKKEPSKKKVSPTVVKREEGVASKEYDKGKKVS
jgi:hypothetical protein